MKKIGFIGIGVMGKSMVKNLVKKGFELKIYSRTKEKARELIESGVEWCDTIKECVKDQDVVITMVGFPKDVREVYFGDQGIIENVTEGTYLIDMTTTSPQLSMEIYAKAKDKGCYALDAPVSGGDIGAQKGTLSIMVGGDKEAFESCHCILEAMGTTIIYEGKAGFGQHTKMSNQIAVAAGIAGTCESIAYAKKVGLSLSTM